ncbi:PqqD family protein [Prevotella corporis]|nr:PqqD family protein [Prevotella corporis]MDQ7736900.1 PqqD family protein [Prevotella corporis]
MKAKKGFNLRQVCGEYIIVAEGDENIDFSNIISMNESSAFLWKEIKDMESFNIDYLVNKMTEEYEIDVDTARRDITTLVAEWGQSGIIEGEDIPEVKLEKNQSELTKENPELDSKEEQKGFFKKLFK